MGHIQKCVWNLMFANSTKHTSCCQVSGLIFGAEHIACLEITASLYIFKREPRLDDSLINHLFQMIGIFTK